MRPVGKDWKTESEEQGSPDVGWTDLVFGECLASSVEFWEKL